jgi:hypothetical protein
MSHVIVGTCASFVALAATKPKNLVSDSRVGIVLLSLAVGGLIEFTILNNNSTKMIQVAFSSWIVLWFMCYWDNSRGELTLSWRPLGVGPISLLDAILLW